MSTILSARACAVLARREHERDPHATRAELLDRLLDAGADPHRASRGIDLAADRGWLGAARATGRAAA
jgi:hypothetical protein